MVKNDASMTDGFSLKRVLRVARYRITDVLSCHPSVYLPLARRFSRARDGSDRAVGRDTALVIEAFPRSGNTFARFAFELAQPRPVKLAHHLHAAAQVIAAARWRVPALVIMRDPCDAVLSLHVRMPWVSLREALLSYHRFYRAVQPHRRAFVLARFETIIRDFGQAIAAVNERFDTDFTPFEHNDRNEQAVFDRMAEHHRIARPSDRLTEQTIGRPMPQREARKEQLRQVLDAPALTEARAIASELYNRMIDTADV